jgi:hypothetical protein
MDDLGATLEWPACKLGYLHVPTFWVNGQPHSLHVEWSGRICDRWGLPIFRIWRNLVPTNSQSVRLTGKSTRLHIIDVEPLHVAASPIPITRHEYVPE